MSIGIREIIVVLTALLLSAVSIAQPYWIKDIGGPGNDHTSDIQTDTDGSIYITGEFSGTIEFDGQFFTSAGSLDLFVARLTAAGDLVWFKHGGGPALDRGRALSLGDDVLAITGEFMGTATFQGTTFTSAGGSTDVFVAVLNKSDGSLEWLRHGGSPTGSDIPHGVCISADGKVSVAGEFRGTATWEGSSLTSMIDPNTNQPGHDVFIACYSGAGALLWLKQGAAKFADKAVDIVAGPAGELYVTGQYSDTITFDQTHPNTLANASFLLRLDTDGNEVWFRRFGGAGYNHVNDMVLGPDNTLKIVGDLQGSMVYSGVTPVNISPAEPFCYYLLSVGLNGELTEHTTVGSGSGVTGRALDASAEYIVVFGEFNCRFDALSDHYTAPGIFMATGIEDLFITRHQPAGLGLIDAQQLGGRSEKSATGIAFLPQGNLVFCGSFQHELFFPSGLEFTADVSTLAETIIGVWSGDYCEDDNYGNYAGNVSAGFQDGFVAMGHVDERQPYDWWERLDNDCERVPLEPCIRKLDQVLCGDTITACGSASLEVRTNFSHSTIADSHFLGPAVNYLWSTGSTNPTITVNASGTYSVTLTSTNGCWQWTVSVEVEILPLPPAPLISDGTGLNTSTTSPQEILLCDNETAWVWATNGDLADEFWWTIPNSTEQVFSDSIQVNSAGNYTFVMTNGNNCVSLVTVAISVGTTTPMPEIDISGLFTFTQDQDNNDSISFCDGNVILYQFVPEMFADGIQIPFPDDLLILWSYSPFPPQAPTTGGTVYGTWDVFGSGWYTVSLNFLVTNAPCGEDSLYYTFTDSIHVTILPTTVTDVNIIGAPTICSGTTALLVSTCSTCTSFSWNGPGFTLLAPDTIQITEPGTYSVAASLTNEFGCSFSETAYFIVTAATGFTINSDPQNGVICPGATAELFTTTEGIEHVWYGPDGAILDADGTLETDVPGEYTLSMNMGGCVMTSNSITLTSYAAPYMIATPAGVICGPEDEVVLEVIAYSSAIVEWQSPLSGNDPIQVVNEAGTYTSIVTGCGVTTTLSTEVFDAPIVAELLTPGPYTICPGDSVLLEAAPGADSYVWLPGEIGQAAIWATEGGTYDLVAQNVEGCTDTASVLVSLIEFNEPLVALGDSICAGEVATLSATGSGVITWAYDAGGTDIIGTGGQISIEPAGTILIYVQQSDADCTAPAITVEVVVNTVSDDISLEGPGSICAGEDLLLQVIAPADHEFVWNTPGGIVDGDHISITNVTQAATGEYEVIPSLNGCTGPGLSHYVNVVGSPALDLPSQILFCAGEGVTLSIPISFTAVQWSNGSTAHEVFVITTDMLQVSAVGPEGCNVSATVELIAEDCLVEIPNVFTPNGDGVNDVWSITSGSASVMARIRNRWGQLMYEGDIVSRPWDGRTMAGLACTDGVYYYELQLKRSDGSTTNYSGHIQLVQ